VLPIFFIQKACDNLFGLLAVFAAFAQFRLWNSHYPFFMAKRWVLGVLAGILFSILAIYPQYRLYQIRGSDYKAAFASCDLDEMAYASYLQALIDGRVRKNDPYTGRDSSSESPVPESLFSIQFLPAYVSAGIARVFGLSASETMPVISVLSAFLTALALFWLIVSFTNDELVSFVGTLVVLVFAALVVGIGAIGSFSEGGIAYPFFPMMRRPIPSIAFPMFFSFFACIWNGLRSTERRRRDAYMVAAAACFTFLIFSYFYLWTSAAAVMSGFVLFFAVLPNENRTRDVRFLLSTSLLCLMSLAPYAWLLAGRNKMADKAQLLVLTRHPDLTRSIETLGLILIMLAALSVVLRAAKFSDRRVQFIAAIALSPVIVFNQQVITGHSLQPFHYEYYVVNYVVLLGIVLLAALFWGRYLARFRRTAVAAALLLTAGAILWGYIETTETTEFWDDVNVRRDEAMPVNRRLRELADSIDSARTQTTVNLESLQADGQTTNAPQPVLWARHQHTFSGVTSWEENKRRYYQLLYYSDLDGHWLKSALTGCSDIEACMALFGWDRFNPTLSSAARPLTHAEIEEETASFEEFVTNYSFEEAGEPQLTYAVVYNASRDRLVNLDRWYQRDQGEVLGEYTLYRLQLRPLEQ
jgi:hypothetical protein